MGTGTKKHVHFDHKIERGTVKKTWRRRAAKQELTRMEGWWTFTSILQLLSPVVGAVLALHAEVDVGADAAVVEGLDRPHVVTHAEEYLRGLVLTQQPQRVHLEGMRSRTSWWRVSVNSCRLKLTVLFSSLFHCQAKDLPASV